MGKINQCIAITIAVFFLLIVLGSFLTVHNQAPEQDTAKYTGYPVWHPPIEGMNGRGNDQQTVTLVLFSSTLMLLSGYFIIKLAYGKNTNKRKLTIFVLNNNKTVPTTRFNVVLGLYSLITASNAMVYCFFDLGKLLASVAILHNALEFVIVVIMHYGGKITSNKFYGILPFYVLVASGLFIFLNWPYDALWFKMQGLCLDWAVLIQFIRMYINTKENIKADSSVDPLIVEEGNNTVADDEDDDDNNENDNDNGNDDDDDEDERLESDIPKSGEVIVHHPSQLLLLILAAGVHLLGNLAITVRFDELVAYEIFSFAFAVAYPILAYYVYLDTQAITALPQKLIYLPSTTFWKVVVVAISCLTLSLACIRIGLFIAGANSN